MATTNPVFQVLVAKDNQDTLAKDLPISSLLPGQLGVFNYHNNLSVDETSAVVDTKDIFIAVGLDKTGSATLEDINKSAGQVIQIKNAKAYTVKGYVDAVQKVVQITGFKAKCDTDYLFKVEFRSQQSYATNGYNQFAKTYSYHTGCCADDCTTCADGDCNELAQGLVDAVNADPDLLITAAVFANTILATINTAPTADGNTSVIVGTTVYVVAVLNADTATQAAAKIVAAINTQTDSPYYATNTGAAITIHAKATATGDTATFAVSGSGVTANAISLTTTVVSDLTTFESVYPGVCLGIRLTTNVDTLKPFSTVNVKYYNPRGTNIIVSLTEGLGICNGTVTTVTELQYSEGKGYDIEHLEYIAGGWNGKPGPYRLSPSTGLAREGFEYYAVRATNYNVVTLEYDQFSVGGWLEYLNNLRTIIAIPCADSVTLLAFIAILDAIFTQFAPMANDVATMDCTNAATHTLTAATDGIESLS